MSQYDLSKFTTYTFESRAVIRVKISNDAAFFTTSAIKKIGTPGYVQVLINEKGKQIAISSTAKDEDNAIKLYKQSGGGAHIKHKGLLAEIARIMGCSVDALDLKAYGITLEDYVIFDLATGTKWKQKE